MVDGRSRDVRDVQLVDAAFAAFDVWASISGRCNTRFDCWYGYTPTARMVAILLFARFVRLIGDWHLSLC